MCRHQRPDNLKERGKSILPFKLSRIPSRTFSSLSNDISCSSTSVFFLLILSALSSMVRMAAALAFSSCKCQSSDRLATLYRGTTYVLDRLLEFLCLTLCMLAPFFKANLLFLVHRKILDGLRGSRFDFLCNRQPYISHRTDRLNYLIGFATLYVMFLECLQMCDIVFVAVSLLRQLFLVSSLSTQPMVSA